MSQDELNQSQVPDPEVVPQAKRRRFSAKYKLRILEEAEGCRKPGEIGALLRREGLYSSYLTAWRRQRERGHANRCAALSVCRPAHTVTSLKLALARDFSG
jgi:transposase-like protein